MIRTFLKSTLLVVFALGFVMFANAQFGTGVYSSPQGVFPAQSEIPEPLRQDTNDASGIQTKTGPLVVDDGDNTNGVDFEVTNGLMRVAGLASVGGAVINSDIKVGSSDLHPNATIQMYRLAHSDASKNICADDLGNITHCSAVAAVAGDGTASVQNTSMVRISANVSNTYCPSPVAYVINWGDGNTQTISPNTGTIQHNYSPQGDYVITFGDGACDVHIISDHVVAIDFSTLDTIRQFELATGGSGGGATRLSSLVNSYFSTNIQRINIGNYPITSFNLDQLTQLEAIVLAKPSLNLSNTSLTNMVGVLTLDGLTSINLNGANLQFAQVEEFINYYHTKVDTNGSSILAKTVYLDDSLGGGSAPLFASSVSGAPSAITKAEALEDSHGWNFNLYCDAAYNASYDACN